jgi:NAD(P)-dependent dehydrogenase (short-subunit alcohol dehydrogenase family)
MKELAGRGALITGGASGIGLAMAHAFAARGMRIVLCDRDSATLETAAEILRASGGQVLAIHLDVCDRAAWQAAAEATRAFARLHVVCANAGISPAGTPLTETTPEAWDRIIAINLTGVFNTVHATAPLIKDHGQGGHFVLTSSMAGMLAASPIADYAVAKFGVSAMGEALQAELAPQNIGVSILCPGVVATPLVGESRSIGMTAECVALRVLQAIHDNDLYVFTHADYRPLVDARFNSILSAFGESAQANFHEGEAVIQMMTPPARPHSG